MAAVYAFDYSDGSTAVVGSSGDVEASAALLQCTRAPQAADVAPADTFAASRRGWSCRCRISLLCHPGGARAAARRPPQQPDLHHLHHHCQQHSRAATVARCDPLFVNVDAGGAASRPAADQQRPARCVRCRLVLAFASQSWFADSIRQIQAIQRREWDGYPFRQLPCFIDKVHGEVDLVQAGAILRHLARSTTCTAVTLGTAARVDMMLDAVAELRGKLRDVVVVQRLGEGGRCWRRSSSSRRTT
ncbi:hypothetical protein HXX76_007188 [Chlamydomonas incerta]|uniref:Uncharacterized protein n=1 Tax=Chlamydomonas incerta TaxID=51695 RepID=A0A835VZK7_CHLIN|nr:hypothetical protein HXX76_007188 [Chlamydomonas incerta]|eukprot:KAG2435102.1 hypothetical protein HXX76_007188 [Chlamydomonas incerta]